ncbi:hypothetical protein SASPL_150770 [Salvia splendens]|uniref:Alpha/beta hydrolase fold-3 domain-containing protein n=1 Tax=Salvia splendens TaxID=180675 RepID=A0A8X8W6T3_SALSN|nr:hypothetical protein SASPL_150770 [Salvia splendens]
MNYTQLVVGKLDRQRCRFPFTRSSHGRPIQGRRNRGGYQLSARIYLPPNADPTKKLPLLVYYHGGGFIVESTFSPLYHKHLNHLVTQANVVAVSVNYRLAPEFPLPIAFEDSWRALKWIAEGKEEWIKEYADLKCVYLRGDGAGGNIAHNIAMRVGESEGFQFGRDVPELPRLWGVDPIGRETAEEFKKWLD